MAEKAYEFEADTGKILGIVINSLYSQKEIFLRELISNSSDAINKRTFQVTAGKTSANTFAGEINVSADKKNQILTISDNGIGLDSSEMQETLGTIASSGTKAFVEHVEKSKDKSNAAAQLIGQFGVGFYSAFMVADRIEVISKKFEANKANKWSSDGRTGFSISEADRGEVGTDVILHLRKDAKEFLEKQRVSYLVKKYSDYIAQPIFWVGPKQDKEQLNSAVALWTRPAKEISKDEYKNFYSSIASAYDDPFSVLHNHTEGTVEFTNLLFLPSQAPFDLYDPERRSRLQLYVNRVFITDNYEGLLPKWLRFVRGVIDTPDVDLNVSREMLQQNPAVQRINKSIIRRTLGEFKKSLQNRREEYDTFWSSLGRVIKEGIYEDSGNREKILEISMFNSTKTDKLTTLSEYVDGFEKGQDCIYYLSAENADLARRSPHLEAFEAKGIDVLLLTDPIDDFWLSQVKEFSGKNFQSITRGEIDLSSIGDSSKSEEKEDSTVLSEGFIGQIKKSLDNLVSDVRGSKNMETSLARLVNDKDGMDPQMEQMMRIHNPDFVGPPKILEINAKHPLIQSIQKKSETGKLENSSEFARLIFDSALVAEGKTIADPREFSERLIKIMERALLK